MGRSAWMVATSETRAAEAGAQMLRSGGNAIDAAVATAACLTVTEPTGNGLGGDLFALVWGGSPAGVHALSSSGASPAALTREAIGAGLTEMPLTGWPTVTVPGMVGGWGELHRRFGSKPFAELLKPAISAARGGFEVGPITAGSWERARKRFEVFDEWRRVFMPNGRTPRAGERFANPDLAGSLEVLAKHGAAGFYEVLGPIIAKHAAETGGYLTPADFTAHRALWVDPLRVAYGRWTVLGMTAPTQGIVALEALGMLDGLSGVNGEVVRTHRAVEAIKLAFADAYASVADPRSMRRPPHATLDPAYLTQRRALIDDERAGPPVPDPGIDGGTVLLCTADATGQMVCLIQSNFHGFGSGIVVPGTGIAMQNRGAGFSLDPKHPNAIGPGKRPFHTILPGMLLGRDGNEPVGVFGCMGGQMQPQGHVQLVAGLAAGDTPQAALDRPRWRWLNGGQLALEQGFDPQLAAQLAKRGHHLRVDEASNQFGGGQIILRDAKHGWVGGSDPRKDGRVITGEGA